MLIKRHQILQEEAGDEAGGGGEKDLATQLEETNKLLVKEGEARARAEGEAAALRHVTANLPEKEVKREEVLTKQFTRSELDAMVEAEKLTKAEADNYFELQLTNKVTREVSKHLTDTLARNNRNQKIGAEIEAYQEAFPDSMKDGSDTRTKMSTEYNRLVEDLGYAKGPETQLLAAKAVLGVLPKGKPKDLTRESRESHQDTGGAGGGAQDRNQDKGSKDPTVRMGLSSREKKYYEGMIEKGIYKDWKDVEDTMKHSNPGIRKKYSAMSA